MDWVTPVSDPKRIHLAQFGEVAPPLRLRKRANNLRKFSHELMYLTKRNSRNHAETAVSRPTCNMYLLSTSQMHLVLKGIPIGS